MTKVFTGGSGKAGRHVIPYLISKGHKVLNLDLVPFPDPSVDVYTLKTDLTDSGQVFNALTSHFNMTGYNEGPVPSAPDVVIHFAGEFLDLNHETGDIDMTQRMRETCSFLIQSSSRPMFEEHTTSLKQLANSVSRRSSLHHPRLHMVSASPKEMQITTLSHSRRIMMLTRKTRE